MKYIAKKPCNFCGKKYFIGEEIPAEHILDPNAQKMMGIIEVVEGDSENADPTAGGLLLPPAPTLEDHEEEKNAKEDVKIYSRHSLNRMKKDELLCIAEKAGVKATAEMTNGAIVELILAEKGE